MKPFKMMGSAMLAATLLVGGLTLAADSKQPSGMVSIDETQFALIVGGSTGGGRNSFERITLYRHPGLVPG